MFKEYTYIYYFFIVCIFLVILLLVFSVIFVKQRPDMEKLSSYECGFNPFEDARLRFEIRFFLVGLLFLVFDLEVAFLLPWVIVVKNSMSFLGFIVMIFFLIFLIFSFFLEWWKGALDWE